MLHPVAICFVGAVALSTTLLTKKGMKTIISHTLTCLIGTMTINHQDARARSERAEGYTMVLITIYDVVTFPDRDPQRTGCKHILTDLNVCEFVGIYTKRIAETNTRYASTGMGGWLEIINVVEVGNPDEETIHAMQSRHFSGGVMLRDGTEISFDTYKRMGRATSH
jgi:hypothetical protein